MEFEIELLGKPCGILKIANERFAFRYLESYLAANEPPISVAMPLNEEGYSDERTFPFFENLLPEGQIRQLMAEQLKTAPNNFSRLLESVGGDVAGAIRILTKENLEARESREPEKLTRTRLGDILERIEVSPFRIDETQKPRLSLAGAQNKLPVIVKDGDVYLTHGQASTHIIKPPSKRFPHLVQNEYLCMRSARRAGIDTANVSMMPYLDSHDEQHECLVIERYDREPGENSIRRIHQEDICQVMSIPSAQKYAKDGGPGYQELFESVRKFTSPSAIYQNEIIKRLLFNILVGNNDAHAKNFSLLHTTTHIKLAPAYDIVNTEAYEELDSHFAMPIGQATTKEEMNIEHLKSLEKQTQIKLSRQKKNLRSFIEHAFAAIEAETLALEENSHPEIQRLLKPLRKGTSRNYEILLGLLRNL